MDLLILRVLVNAFDPIGTILPALIGFAIFRKQALGWLYTGLLVAAVRALLGALLMTSPTGGFIAMMAFAGFFGGILWFYLAKGFGALKNLIAGKGRASNAAEDL